MDVGIGFTGAPIKLNPTFHEGSPLFVHVARARGRSSISTQS